ncbi:MAG TPA: GAF domain-containing sensor histidine kinase [Streptosporangiaceae bacterium]|nr:GAF domain-containing sensor histidine kinase [Streptosporangiaceae bacterium]
MLLQRLRARTGVIVFGIMGGLIAAYLLWLVVRGSQALQLGVLNGWVGTAFRLAAGVVCVIGGLRRRPGSYVPLVFGLALIFTAIGNTVLTLYSLHGPPPPPPTAADFFGLGFIVLCFVGIGLMAREERERLSPRELLDGGIAALGVGAVCAAFVLAHIPHQVGESRLGSASQLAFPIGFVVLVVIVVGAATVASERSPVAWVALTAAFALLALGSALSAAVGFTVSIRILTTIQWPAAALLIAASMWADPGVPDPLAARKGTVVWIPALACAAAIAVLVAGTFRRVDYAAIALAAAALVLVMLRGISELRHEIAARERTEVSLRASEAGYRRVADEQAALRRVATLVARGGRPSEVFAAVTGEAGRVLGTDVTLLRRYLPGPAAATIAAFAAGERLPPEEPRPLGGHNIATLVHQTGRPVRVEDSDWLLRDRQGQELPITSGVGVPVVVAGSLWGAMVVASSTETPLPPDTEARLAAFTELIGMAIANAQAHDELSASRARVVASADETRRRIERDLHDGAQQQFVSLALHLRAVQALVLPNQAKLADELNRVATGLSDALDDLREFSRGIHPAILAKAGLGLALRALGRRCPVPVELDVRAGDRLPERVEVTAYYIVSEALTNAAKHAKATAVHVDVDVDATRSAVRLAVRDDGAGGADPARGSGLLGLYDRVEAAGGTITIHSPIGEGTELLVELPLRPVPAPD